MAYKMKGSPAKLGTIQGTSGHASALKRISSRDTEQSDREVKIAKNKETLAKIEEDRLEREKKTKKQETKSEVKDSGWVKGEEFDVTSDAYEGLSDAGKAWVTKKNKKLQAKRDKEIGEAKTESHFDIMNALGGFLSGGGGKEGLGAAFQAGFSKKSPNEILAMQEAREARSKGDDVIETDYIYGMSPKEDQFKETKKKITKESDLTTDIITGK